MTWTTEMVDALETEWVPASAAVYPHNGQEYVEVETATTTVLIEAKNLEQGTFTATAYYGGNEAGLGTGNLPYVVTRTAAYVRWIES